MEDMECMTLSLFHNGYVFITGPAPGFPGDGTAHAFSKSQYEEMINAAHRARLDPHSTDFHFSDLASRGPGRWEISVNSSVSEELWWLDQLWKLSEEEIILPLFHSVADMEYNHPPPASPDPHIYTTDQNCKEVLKDPQFTTVFDGTLISIPGADLQHWHRDSGLKTECMNHFSVYISTTNVLESMGPTQFLPGTNRDFSFQFDNWAGFFEHCPDLRMPLPSAGSILIWEYRTIHRGTRNVHPQEPRPMLYKTYHVNGAWTDINMGTTSFYDAVNT
mmetsp:Transcript_7801/g.12940  ORF Transcript_7801/g.12940 Transcript_7801/m.12940 type:complete len:276 (+) Transcript_7801:605-1432(+)